MTPLEAGGEAARLEAELEAWARDAACREPRHFLRRQDALDRLEFGIAEGLQGLERLGWEPERLARLRRLADRIQEDFLAVDEASFAALRAELRAAADKGAAFRARVREVFGAKQEDFGGGREDSGDEAAGEDSRNGIPSGAAGIGWNWKDAKGSGPGTEEPAALWDGASVEGCYDALDAWANGLLLPEELPGETDARGPEGVFYQKSPARLAFEVAGRLRGMQGAVFYDLGSGPGQFLILVHLLSGARCVGLDVEPAFAAYGRRRAAELGLAGVEFVAEDARVADMGEGTVFYLYTPFLGETLRTVLDRLRESARRRPIRIFALGPCVAEVAAQAWLEQESGPTGGSSLAGFRS